MADDAGDEVAIGAGAQEACHAVAGDLVAGGEGGHLAHQLLLRQRRWQVEAVNTQLRWDVGKQLVGGSDAGSVEHGATVFIGVGDVGVGGGHSASLSMKSLY